MGMTTRGLQIRTDQVNSILSPSPSKTILDILLSNGLSVRRSITARMVGSHPTDPGSIPGAGAFLRSLPLHNLAHADVRSVVPSCQQEPVLGRFSLRSDICLETGRYGLWLIQISKLVTELPRFTCVPSTARTIMNFLQV